MQNLTLKYRPRQFSDMVGQDVIAQILLNASKQARFSHSYLFTGPRGTGKTSSARIVAKALLCEKHQDGEPCLTCENCTMVEKGNHPDLIEMDAASHTSVDDMRDLIEKAQFMPSLAKNKVYIIDEVHMLSKSAFNALLKTLEEPPAHVYFILATTEVHKLPETIVSRCQRFDFKRITDQDIARRLDYICKEEKITAESQALELIAEQVNGGMRDAIMLLEQFSTNGKIQTQEVRANLGLTSEVRLKEIYTALQAKDLNSALEYLQVVYSGGANLARFCKELIEYIRQRMLTKVQNKESFDFEIQAIEVLLVAQSELKTSNLQSLPLELSFIKICGSENSTKIEKKTPEIETPKKAEEKIETKVAPQKEEKESSTDEIPLTAEQIAGLRKNLQTATLKVALKSVTPTLAGDTLYLGVSDDFMEEQLKSPSAVSEVEKSAEKIFGKSVVVKTRRQTYSPKVETKPAPKEAISLQDLEDVFGAD